MLFFFFNRIWSWLLCFNHEVILNSHEECQLICCCCCSFKTEEYTFWKIETIDWNPLLVVLVKIPSHSMLGSSPWTSYTPHSSGFTGYNQNKNPVLDLSQVWLPLAFSMTSQKGLLKFGSFVLLYDNKWTISLGCGFTSLVHPKIHLWDLIAFWHVTKFRLQG